MTLPALRLLDSAYQLHFYLAFKTRYLRPLLKTPEERALVMEVLNEVCHQRQFHMLDANIQDNYLRLLMSLKPDQSVSETVRLLKANVSREFGIAFRNELDHQRARTLWARGYFARSSGKVNLEAARKYVDEQVTHHGYSGSWTNRLRYRNFAFKSPAFTLPHSVCMLDYHVVFATEFRLPLFDEIIAPKLFHYLLSVGQEHGFAIDRMSLLPDHLHILLEAIPSLSIYELATAILNNTRHWMTKHFWGNLKRLDAWNVWQPSFYAGTVGEYSTAQVKRFLLAV